MRWVAYLSDESGRDEVLVQSFPVLGAKFQIFTAGGAGSNLDVKRVDPLEWPAPQLMDSAQNGAGLFESPNAADLERRILIGAVEAGDSWLLEHQPVDTEACVQPLEVLCSEALPS